MNIARITTRETSREVGGGGRARVPAWTLECTCDWVAEYTTATACIDARERHIADHVAELRARAR